ncbi:sulfotransferase family protein [Haliangium sp.]|uniref:sulfotransferase family protein n=1 Tax=Haliangium sp. TaxID=2663208 RepID=UPI003D0AC1B0
METAARGETVDWDALFDGYRATVDYPGCMFYRPLMERYPQAKVILTVRDPDKWYESAHSTIYPAGRPDDLPAPPPSLAEHMRMVSRLVWDGHFGGRFADRAHAIQVFQDHIEEVKQTVPAERLLVYEVREGWAPLCAFLDVPVPDEPFPRTNSRPEFYDMLRRFATE